MFLSMDHGSHFCCSLS